jgi:hypothetical protein
MAQLKPYLEEQERQRQAAFDGYLNQIAELRAKHDYSSALDVTKTALVAFPNNPSLRKLRKDLKREAKDASKFEVHQRP